MRAIAIFLLGGLLGTLASAATAPPPNLVVIDDHLGTSGQPSAAWLATLSAQGYQADIYLAPSDSDDAVRDEPRIVRAQGLEFHHLPIPFGKPTPAHYTQFAALLHSLRGKKVLVHCQVNMRASTMVFLYRVLEEHVEPEKAYAAVTPVWVPEGPWKTLMMGELTQHGVGFDPF